MVWYKTFRFYQALNFVPNYHSSADAPAFIITEPLLPQNIIDEAERLAGRSFAGSYVGWTVERIDGALAMDAVMAFAKTLGRVKVQSCF